MLACGALPKVPLSSLRLWIPPLRLLSAFLWQVAEQRQVKFYTSLEEFVSVVLEIIPDLLSVNERAELLLGLKAKFILELCHDLHSVDLKTLQPHLESVSRISEFASDKTGDKTIDAAVKNFVGLIKELLQSPTHKKHFFQDIYPLHYGAKYDTALQLLVWQFLCRLEMAIPVPSFNQIAFCFEDGPSLLEDVLQVFKDPKEVHNLLLQFKHFGHLDPGSPPSSVLGNTILSTLLASFTVNIVPTPFGEVDKCLSSTKEKEADGHVAVEEEDQCGPLDPEDRHGDVNESDPHVPRSHVEKHKTLPTGGRPVSNKTDQVASTNSDEGPVLSSPQSTLVQEGSPSTNTAADAGSQVVGHECTKDFSKISPAKHQVVETGDRPHVCSYCGKAYKQKGHLTEHIRGHTGERPYRCTVCGKGFHRRGLLLKHKLQHAGGSPVSSKTDQVTPACSDEGPVLSSPQGTLVQEGSPSTNTAADAGGQVEGHECNKLGKAFSKSSLSKHQDVQTGDRPYVCSYCDKAFSRKDLLKEHTWVHTGERPHRCTVCGKGFRRRGLLLKHKLQHASRSPVSNKTDQVAPACSDEGSVLSSPQRTLVQEGSPSTNTAADAEGQVIGLECTKDFSKSSPAKHQVVETGDRPHVCSYCGKAFKQKGHLTEHIKGHTGEQPYRCTVCGKGFHRSHALLKHSQLHTAEKQSNGKARYTGEKPHMCSFCGKTFRYKSTLAIHIRVHTGERPYVCSVCGKRFNQSSILTGHMRQHTGDRPYLCSVCGKGFPVHGSLLVHMRLHTGERPYKCEFCGKCYRISSGLVRHRRVHTREKPYKCSVCEKRFICHNGLKRHMRTHTGEKPYECLQCGKRCSLQSNLRVHQRVHR